MRMKALVDDQIRGGEEVLQTASFLHDAQIQFDRVGTMAVTSANKLRGYHMHTTIGIHKHD
jgi:hypothetical protein